MELWYTSTNTSTSLIDWESCSQSPSLVHAVSGYILEQKGHPDAQYIQLHNYKFGLWAPTHPGMDPLHAGPALGNAAPFLLPVIFHLSQFTNHLQICNSYTAM